MNRSLHNTSADTESVATASAAATSHRANAGGSTSPHAIICVERSGPRTLEFVRDELRRNWHSTTIFSRGVRFEADALPAFVALDPAAPNRPLGHLTYHVDHHGLEVITLAARESGRGVGTALMDHAEQEARSRGATRLFLTTTNDNLDALRFYQRRGMHIAAVHVGMMDRYRAAGEPVPGVGKHGIPLRDEIELEISFTTTQAPPRAKAPNSGA